MPTFPYLRAVRRDFDDEVGVEGDGDPVEQGDGGDDPACFETGLGRLGHSSSGGELDLGQAELQPAVADGLADEVGAARFGVALAVVRAASGTFPVVS